MGVQFPSLATAHFSRIHPRGATVGYGWSEGGPVMGTPMKLNESATGTSLLIISLTLLLVTAGCPIMEPPLYKASEKGDIAQVKKLLSEGADPNSRSTGDEKRPALVAAVQSGNIGVVKLLLENGVDVNAGDTLVGWTPLMRAVSHYNRHLSQNRIAMTTLLLGAGADVNARDKYGFTPLIFACGAEPANQELVLLLIGSGADINARNSRGKTALSSALDSRDTAIAKLLLRLGAE